MRITLAIPTYNSQSFIGEAVAGALSQTHRDLQIIVSDDASRDNTLLEIERALSGYSGPHQIAVLKSDTNTGLNGNIERTVAAANGEWILFSSGDDVSTPERVAVVAAAIEKNKNATAVYSDYIPIGKNGVSTAIYKQSPKLRTDCSQVLSLATTGGGCGKGALYGYRKDVFAWPYSFGQECKAPEDRVLPFRAAILGQIVHIRAALLKYRTHGDNTSFSSEWVANIIYSAPHLAEMERTIMCAQKSGRLSARHARLVKFALWLSSKKWQVRNKIGTKRKLGLMAIIGKAHLLAIYIWTTFCINAVCKFERATLDRKVSVGAVARICAQKTLP